MLRRLIPLLIATLWAFPGLAEVASQTPIFAEYSSELGASNVREVRLVVDGREVTDEATVTPLRVTYAPAEPLPEGQHVARVEVVDGLGRTFIKEWQFTVEPQAPVLDEVWSEELLIELQRPPRRVRDQKLALAGWTQPGAEVIVRRDGAEASRVLASESGRFTAHVGLDEGDNALALVARRLGDGDEGPEVSLRVERIVEKPRAEEDDGHVTKPPTRRIPVPRVGPPRVVLASSGFLLDPSQALPQWPKEPETVPPSRLERPPRAPRAGADVDTSAPSDATPIEMPGGDDPKPVGEVIITKPNDGEMLRQDHVTVLGRAPAGWRVAILVDGRHEGEDVANPAGHFTVPRVELGPGEHELVAEAESEGLVLRSRPVNVSVESPRFMLAPDTIALTSPTRPTSVARASVQRVSGQAWDGAEIEIEVNGRIVAREIAGLSGRFDVDVPLEPGLNLLRVEAMSSDLARVARSREYAVSASGRAGSSPSRQARTFEPRPRPPSVGGLRPRASMPSAQVPSRIP